MNLEFFAISVVIEKYEREAWCWLFFGRQEILPIFYFQNCQQSHDLVCLERLTRISNKFLRKLDLGFFDPIGEGSFGSVYKAQMGKQDVAVKILKGEGDWCSIEILEREADMLR